MICLEVREGDQRPSSRMASGLITCALMPMNIIGFNAELVSTTTGSAAAPDLLLGGVTVRATLRKGPIVNKLLYNHIVPTRWSLPINPTMKPPLTALVLFGQRVAMPLPTEAQRTLAGALGQADHSAVANRAWGKVLCEKHWLWKWF